MTCFTCEYTSSRDEPWTMAAGRKEKSRTERLLKTHYESPSECVQKGTLLKGQHQCIFEFEFFCWFLFCTQASEKSHLNRKQCLNNLWSAYRLYIKWSHIQSTDITKDGQSSNSPKWLLDTSAAILLQWSHLESEARARTAAWPSNKQFQALFYSIH